MNKNYSKLIQGIDLMSESLIEIGRNADNKPIKLLVSKLVDKLGFNDLTVGEDIAMIRFAVANDDESLEKLTAQITGGVAEPEAKPKKAVLKAKAVVDNPEPEAKPEVKEDASTKAVSGE